MVGNIALVGFMGTGKSTVGRALAERLHREFIDTDSLIQDRLGMPVSQVFATLGEPAFRDVERQVIEESVQKPNVVIAVGGGALESRQVRQLLKRHSTVVLLTADMATLLERTQGVTGRPLLDGFDTDVREARILELLHARAKAYQEVYDITVNTSQSLESVVDSLAEVVRDV